MVLLFNTNDNPWLVFSIDLNRSSNYNIED